GEALGAAVWDAEELETSDLVAGLDGAVAEELGERDAERADHEEPLRTLDIVLGPALQGKDVQALEEAASLVRPAWQKYNEVARLERLARQARGAVPVIGARYLRGVERVEDERGRGGRGHEEPEPEREPMPACSHPTLPQNLACTPIPTEKSSFESNLVPSALSVQDRA